MGRLDQDGTQLLSRRVPNGEPELLQLLQDVLALGERVTWPSTWPAANLHSSGSAGWTRPGAPLHSRPVVNRAGDGYRGEGKTDARGALVIADQARIRRDLRPMRPTDETTIELKILHGSAVTTKLTRQGTSHPAVGDGAGRVVHAAVDVAAVVHVMRGRLAAVTPFPCDVLHCLHGNPFHRTSWP
ncbi:transposase [Streptomyces sp. NPDC002668]|uniref:IS110 family transposase n=1 Tax=Streptomyces sp. NPDC002668 TaxID=3154422 RepID=UPI003330FBE2